MAFLSRLFYFFLIATPTLHGFVQANVNPWTVPSGGKSDIPSFTTKAAPQASWSSYVTVDPSSILSLFVKKAGFFLDTKLKSLADLLHCQEAQLNVVDRVLLIRNFTVSLPNTDQLSLRIGRIQVTWDSYTRPCLEVQVQDVEAMVEFSNLLFTRTNWNDLNDRGFPPEILYYDQSATVNASTSTSESESSSEFVRVGSLDFQGRVVLHARSRPLQKAITEDIVINLQSLQELKYKIKALAEANEQTIGRRGLTSDEIYDVVRAFFNDKIKQAVKYAIEDLAATQINPSSQGSQLVNNSKQLFASAKSAVLGYAADVEGLSTDRIKDKLKNLKGQEEGFLLQDEEVDQLVSGSLDAIKSTIRAAGVAALRNIAQLRTSFNGTNIADTTFDDEGPMFADW